MATATKITAEELAELRAKAARTEKAEQERDSAVQALQNPAQFRLSINKNGGLYFSGADFVEISSKGKEYRAGVNMPWQTAKALFIGPNSAEYLKEIKEFLAKG